MSTPTKKRDTADAFTLKDWKGVLDHRYIPSDILNFRKIWPQARVRYASCLGILAILAVFKMPCARESFMEHHKVSPMSSQPKAMFKTCVAVCESLAAQNEILIEEQDDIGGPLKAHGVLRQMIRFGVLVHRDKGRVLGSTGKKLLHHTKMSRDAESSIKAFLNLGPLIGAIIGWGPPKTLDMWQEQSGLLQQAFALEEIDGLLSAGYCSQWLIRTMLDAMLHENIIVWALGASARYRSTRA